MKFQIPCKGCREPLEVTAKDADQSVKCSCGALNSIPTLRNLRKRYGDESNENSNNEPFPWFGLIAGTLAIIAFLVDQLRSADPLQMLPLMSLRMIGVGWMVGLMVHVMGSRAIFCILLPAMFLYVLFASNLQVDLPFITLVVLIFGFKQFRIAWMPTLLILAGIIAEVLAIYLLFRNADPAL